MSTSVLTKLSQTLALFLLAAGTWASQGWAQSGTVRPYRPNSTPVREPAGPQLRRDMIAFEEFVARRRQVEQDLVNQRTMLLERQSQLQRWNAADQQNFQAAFGTSDPTIRAEVMTHIDRQLNMNQQMTASNFQETPMHERGQYAYVYPNNPSTIYLDDLYYSSPAQGVNSRSGTLVHEMSHFNRIAGTDDHTYGLPNSTAIANDFAYGSNPAVMGPRGPAPWTNADNIQYYAEGAFDRPAPTPAPSPAPAPVSRSENGAGQSSNQLANREAVPSNTSANDSSQADFRAEIDRQMSNFRAAEEYNRQNPLSISTPSRSNPTDNSATQPEASSGRLTFDEYAPRNGYDGYGYREDSTRPQYDENGNRPDSTRRQYDENGNREDSTRRQYDENGNRPDSTRRQYDENGNREDSTRRQYDENGNREDSTRRQYDENGNRPDSTRRQYDENGNREDSTRRQYDENGNREDSSRRQYDENGNREDSTRRQYDENGNRPDSTRRQYDENGNRPDSTRPRLEENNSRIDTPDSNGPAVNRRAPGRTSGTASLRIGN